MKAFVTELSPDVVNFFLAQCTSSSRLYAAVSSREKGAIRLWRPLDFLVELVPHQGLRYVQDVRISHPGPLGLFSLLDVGDVLDLLYLDDFEACITRLRFPIAHLRVIRAIQDMNRLCSSLGAIDFDDPSYKRQIEVVNCS